MHPRTAGIYFRQITSAQVKLICNTSIKADSLNATSNHWVCYLCMPERFDYGYTAIATIVKINGQILWILQKMK